MFPFADVTLGFAVFGIGVTFQFLVSSGDRENPGMPFLVKLLSVGMWAGLGLLAWLAIEQVHRVGDNVTMLTALIMCAATVAIGSVLGYLLNRVGGWLIARRGGQIYRQVMREREGRANGQRRWRR